MKKLSKIMSLIVALLMVVSSLSCMTAFAAEYADGDLEKHQVKFYYQAAEPVVNQACNGYRTSDGGSVVYEGYTRAINTFDNGMRGVNFSQIKTSDTAGNSYDNNFLTFTFDTTNMIGGADAPYTLQANDVVYLSFYVRANSKVNVDGKYFADSTAVSQDATSPNITSVRMDVGNGNKKGKTLANLNIIQTNNKRSQGQLFVQSYDAWQKVSFGIKLNDGHTGLTTNNEAGKLKFMLVSTGVNNIAFSYDIADFTIGIMKYTDVVSEAPVTEARAVDYLCRAIESTKADVKHISTDGNVVATTVDSQSGAKNTTYNVTSATGYAPEVVMATNDTGGSFLSSLETSVTKNADKTYKLDCYAPAYNKVSDAPATYVTFDDLDTTTGPNASGVNAKIRTSAIANSSYKETFTLDTGEKDIPEDTVDFYYRSQIPVIKHDVSTNLRTNQGGSVVHEAYDKQIKTFENGMKGVNITQIKNGQQANTTDGNFLSLEFDTTEMLKAADGESPYTIQKDDVLYLSFYVRGHSSFTVDGKYMADGEPVIQNATAANIEKVIVFAGGNNYNKGTAMSNIGAIQASKGRSQAQFFVDAYDTWQKVSFGVRLPEGSTGLENNQTAGKMKFVISTTSINDIAFSYDIADFTFGLLKYHDGENNLIMTNARVIDALCREIEATKPDVKYISVDGSVVATTAPQSGIKLNTLDVVTKTGGAPQTVLATNDADGSFASSFATSTIPLSGKTYELECMAPAYDKVTDSYSKYITFADLNTTLGVNANGVNASLRTSTVENSAYKELFTINISKKPMKLEFFKDGSLAGDLTSDAQGSVYSVKLTGEPDEILNTYSLVLGAYDGNNVLINSNSELFTDGAATVALPKIVNTDGNVSFKVSVWNIENLEPISSMAEIDENTIEIPVIE